ncbi:MAG: efflux RND transporter permease subunit, partial [Pseudomonas sp.]
SKALDAIRAKYEGGGDGSSLPVKIHIVGFAKLVGDLIDGLMKVMGFFVVAAVVAAVIIFLYTRCVRSTLLVLSCSLIAVVWQLGLLVSAGYALDPFSALVPFLVFAIGVSHGAQKMNGIMQDIGKGTHKLVAARYTFRRLFMAGLTALLADAVGFAVLMMIDIPSIRELALTASMGVAVLVFTNLLLLPVLLSYTGVSGKAAARSLRASSQVNGGQGFFDALPHILARLTERPIATAAITVALVISVIGFVISRDLQVGDIDAGAPELRASSSYNLDDAYITSNYGTSSDILAVMVKTAADHCGTYETLTEIDRLTQKLADVPGVQQVQSLSDTVRAYTAGSFEGNPKWFTISNDQVLINPQITNALNWNSEFLTPSCSMVPVLAYLSDHKAQTLNRVVEAVEQFAAEHNTENRQFLLAAGSAGIQAATNIVVKKANVDMLFYVYAAVSLLCLIAFRSWRATIVAIVPLVMTSILAEALMVYLGIGLKVATLPVVALGVGIGVDYSLYLLSAQLTFLRHGESLADAYRHALGFTGKVVALVGVTLAAGVVTWAWSPIRFQADMGILLTFMFLVNMIASIILVPALSHFLLVRPRAGTTAGAEQAIEPLAKTDATVEVPAGEASSVRREKTDLIAQRASR